MFVVIKIFSLLFLDKELNPGDRFSQDVCLPTMELELGNVHI